MFLTWPNRALLSIEPRAACRQMWENMLRLFKLDMIVLRDSPDQFTSDFHKWSEM